MSIQYICYVAYVHFVYVRQGNKNIKGDSECVPTSKLNLSFYAGKTRLTHWLSPTNDLTAHNKQLQAQEISITMLHPFNSKSCKLWDLNFPLVPTCIGSLLSRYALYNCTCTFETLKIRFRNLKYVFHTCLPSGDSGRSWTRVWSNQTPTSKFSLCNWRSRSIFRTVS